VPLNAHLTANLPRNLPVKTVLNRLRFDRIMAMSLWPRFLAHPVCPIVSIIQSFKQLEPMVVFLSTADDVDRVDV